MNRMISFVPRQEGLQSYLFNSTELTYRLLIQDDTEIADRYLQDVIKDEKVRKIGLVSITRASK